MRDGVGGMGEDVNVHVNLQKQLMMMIMMMIMMIMMMMTLMKLVICPGIYKFYQPNSGCAQFQKGGRGYIYILMSTSDL